MYSVRFSSSRCFAANETGCAPVVDCQLRVLILRYPLGGGLQRSRVVPDEHTRKRDAAPPQHARDLFAQRLGQAVISLDAGHLWYRLMRRHGLARERDELDFFFLSAFTFIRVRIRGGEGGEWVGGWMTEE